MAQGLCAKFLSEKLGCEVDCLGEMGYKVGSAGVMAISGLAASAEAVVACGELGVDIGGFRSRSVSDEIVGESDIIFVMCERHGREIAECWPGAAGRCRLLRSGGEIADPVGQDIDVFRRTCGIIEKEVKKRISELLL